MFIHHRHHTRRAAAVTAALFTGALNSAFAPADEPATAPVLVAFSNRTGGSDIVEGNYAAAERALGRRAPSETLDPGSLETNRCVVYTMQRHLPAARIACNEAVNAQREDLTSILHTHSRRQDDTSLALVYSNRAVVRWLLADGEAALKDLARARALAPQAPFVMRFRKKSAARRGKSHRGA